MNTEFEEVFSKEGILMTDVHMKRCMTPLAMREKQLRSITKYHPAR